MRYFALFGVIKRFFLFQLLQESMQYVKKFANEIVSGEIRKGMKVLHAHCPVNIEIFI